MSFISLKNQILGIEDPSQRLTFLRRIPPDGLRRNFECEFLTFSTDDSMIAVILWYSLVHPINADYISDSHVQKCFDDSHNHLAYFSRDSLNEQIDGGTILSNEEIEMMTHVFSHSRPVQDISYGLAGSM